MTAGIIPYSSIPNPVPDGLSAAVARALAAAGFSGTVFVSPSGYEVSDVTTAQNAINAYSGSATELQFWKTKQQAALDAFFDAGFSLNAFIRAGTVTTVTAANVGSFIAQWTNNYRTLRANIASAANVSAVQAINVQSGWPSNP